MVPDNKKQLTMPGQACLIKMTITAWILVYIMFAENTISKFKNMQVLVQISDFMSITIYNVSLLEVTCVN